VKAVHDSALWKGKATAQTQTMMETIGNDFIPFPSNRALPYLPLVQLQAAHEILHCHIVPSSSCQLQGSAQGGHCRKVAFASQSLPDHTGLRVAVTHVTQYMSGSSPAPKGIGRFKWSSISRSKLQRKCLFQTYSINPTTTLRFKCWAWGTSTYLDITSRTLPCRFHEAGLHL
jgi:hypothetical protein